MSWPNIFSNPDALALMIPIAAILVWGILGIVKRIFRHRERMAMIERGMNPDDKPADEKKEEDNGSTL
jgi:hypothetical protein